MVLLSFATWASEPLYPSTFDARVGFGLLQLAPHTYLDFPRVWPRLNLNLTGIWALPGGSLRPILGLHIAAGNDQWFRGSNTFTTNFFRLEPRGGGRLHPLPHFTLDLTFGVSFDKTQSTRAGPVLAASVAWLSDDDRWFLSFESRLAPFLTFEGPLARDLYNPGGSGFLAGIGVRY